METERESPELLKVQSESREGMKMKTTNLRFKVSHEERGKESEQKDLWTWRFYG